jgi:quinol monooxygenase YgiN
MSTLLRLFVAGAAVLMVLAGGTAHAQNGAIYAITYVDVMPNATNPGATALRHYRDASRREDSNLRTDVLQEIARPNRFAIVEVWKDQAAGEAHDKAATGAELVEKLRTIGNAPFDRRINNALYVGSSSSAKEPNAIYVLTHVDVVPQGKDGCMALLKAMSVETPKDAGNIGYTVLQQANRANHFAVFEVWANRKALDGHAEAAHTRAFREKLSPMAGALYDERFYKLVD